MCSTASSSSSPAPASRDIYVTMVRTGEGGPAGISALVVEKDAPGLSFGANEKKMGWNAQPTRQVIFEDVRVPGRPTACRTRASDFKHRHGRASTAAGSTSPPVRSAARRRRSTRRWPMRTSARRSASASRIPGAAVQARRHGDRTRRPRARFLWRAASALDAKAPDATKLCAMAKRFATDTGFDVANDALQIHGGYGYLPITASRRSCATCACTRSSKAPTRSCA